MSEDTELQGMTGAIALILIIVLLALTGCATKPTVSAEDTIKAGLMDGAIAAAKAPLFRLTCPVTGCILGSLEVGNPAGAAQMAEVVRVAMAPQPSEASQNYRATLGFLAPLAGYGVIGSVASNIVGKITDGFKAGFASNTAIADSGFGAAGLIAGKIPQAPVANVTNWNFGNDATVGDGNTRTVNTNTWTNSYNRNAVGGSSGTTGPGGPANNGP